VAKGHAIVPEVAQALASNQRIHGSGREMVNVNRTCPGDRAIRDRPQDAPALTAPAVVRPVGGFPPLPRHVDFRALGIGGAAGRKSREPEQIARDLLRWVPTREQRRELRSGVAQFIDFSV
jgi:hypothetical protein